MGAARENKPSARCSWASRLFPPVPPGTTVSPCLALASSWDLSFCDAISSSSKTTASHKPKQTLNDKLSQKFKTHALLQRWSEGVPEKGFYKEMQRRVDDAWRVAWLERANPTHTRTVDSRRVPHVAFYLINFIEKLKREI